MDWYYVQNGQQVGPISETDLDAFARDGRISPDTLVWHEGMPNWQPLAQAKPAGNYALAGAPATAAIPQPTQSTTSEAVCAECHAIFPVQDMIAHGNVHVCANCKPVFMQRLAE